ncbi:MAG: cell division protein ZapB [Desulfobacterales bacterium]|nr:cell division protein ZapB [Desulfobacterales bacterium]
MDIDDVMLQFDEIEQKVGKLVDQQKALEAKNAELAEKVETLEEELRKKTETENTYSEQKALIRSKIDGLLSKLNELSTNSAGR